MQEIVPVWKPVGKTPLDMVNALKAQEEYSDKTISYAGRLDPMAEGVLLLLVGEENKKRQKYEELEKEYRSEFAWGIETDSYDALGIIASTSLKVINLEDIVTHALGTIGKSEQSYPPYSSKAVLGKPLYWWARKGRLSEIQIPTREIEVHSFEVSYLKKIKGEVLGQGMIERIRKVNGNFRQSKAIASWEELVSQHGTHEFLVTGVQITCGSGTYIRGIASGLGKALGLGAIAISITRTRVGKYTISECVDVEIS